MPSKSRKVHIKMHCYHMEKIDSVFMTPSTVEDRRSLGKMKLNESGRQKEALSARTACNAIIWPTTGLERENLYCPGFPPGGGSLISVTAIPCHGQTRKNYGWNVRRGMYMTFVVDEVLKIKYLSNLWYLSSVSNLLPLPTLLPSPVALSALPFSAFGSFFWLLFP